MCLAELARSLLPYVLAWVCVYVFMVTLLMFLLVLWHNSK